MALVATALITSVASAAPSDGPESSGRGLGISLIGGPQSAAGQVGAGRAIYDRVDPGTTSTWEVQVTNDTPSALDVELLVVDAAVNDTGLDIDDEPSTGPLSQWVQLRPSSLRLDQGQTASVFVDVSPPAQVTGQEVLGALVAAPPPRQEGAVAVVRRVAVPIFVASGLDPLNADFTIDSFTGRRSEEGRPVVDVGVTNTGERTLHLAGLLELSDGPAGLSTDPVLASNTPTVSPGNTGVVRFLLDAALPAGEWNAETIISGGNVERTATGTLELPAEGEGVIESDDIELTGGTDEEGNDISESIRNQRRTLLPLAATLILLALGALWLMVLWKRREEEEDEDGEEAVAATASTGATDDGG